MWLAVGLVLCLVRTKTDALAGPVRFASSQSLVFADIQSFEANQTSHSLALG